MSQELIKKYNVPGPRYTSYPTVPYWETRAFSESGWIDRLRVASAGSAMHEGISLYVHLPFCESMCTFCGCNKHITKNHKVEEIYLDALEREWNIYRKEIGKIPAIREIHLGGGTPTFFSPENLGRLMRMLEESVGWHEERAFSFEGHPKNTTKEHLDTLYEFGYRRVSFGIQDYDPVVQQTINRVQSPDLVARATDAARQVGYDSVGHDLVFGLPRQTMQSMEMTVEYTLKFKPDRIALYSYAHVPWIKGNGQRGFSEVDLPPGEEKRRLYEFAREALLENGYHEIGMDHFALPTDQLYRSLENGSLHRNFMGYTDAHTEIMIGLGVSSISDCWTAFAQNEKTLKNYYNRIADDHLPVFRGHFLNEEDLVIRKHILNLMCRLETRWEPTEFPVLGGHELIRELQEFVNDGLIDLDENKITVHESGRPFIRNICMALDLRLKRKKPETRLFSMTM